MLNIVTYINIIILKILQEKKLIIFNSSNIQLNSI